MHIHKWIYTVPTRPKLTPKQTPTKPAFTFGVYWGFTFNRYAFFFNLRPLGFYFRSTCDLLWVYSGLAFGVHFMHWGVKKTCLLSYHLTACKSRPLYIPDTQLASAFRGLLMTVFTLCVLSRFTLDLLGVNSGSALVNLEWTPGADLKSKSRV